MRRNVLPASEPNAPFVTLNLPYAELHHPQIQDTAGNTVLGCFKYNSSQCIDADVQTFDLVT